MWRTCSRRETSRLMPAFRRSAEVLAAGGKRLSARPTEIHGNAEEAEFLLVPDEDVLRTATLHGKVHIEQTGDQPMRRRCRARRSQLRRQQPAADNSSSGWGTSEADWERIRTQASSSAQDFELTAPVIDFSVAEGHILRHANTSGPPQIIIAQQNASASTSSAQQTVVTAGRFDADFSDGGRAQSPVSRAWRSQRANCELKSRPAGQSQHQ